MMVQISDLAFNFYVDGILSETVAQAGTLRSYDHVRLGSGLPNAGIESYYDNVTVVTAAVPEPSTVALGVTGLLFLAYKKRALFLGSRS